VSVYDRFLDDVYQDAFDNFRVVEQRFVDGIAIQQELEDARSALAGGRPRASTNVNIVETAQRANNNFSRIRARKRERLERSYVPTSDTQGAGLSPEEVRIAANGQRFTSRNVERSNANQYAEADIQQAGSAVRQLNKILATPPLTLLVNPEQLTVTYAHKQTYTDRNRFNYIFQRWGEEQVRLSVTGKSGGFVTDGKNAADLGEVRIEGGRQTANVSGYQFASKWDSTSWQNLMALFAIYRNNGYIYRNGSEAHLYIGNVEIEYDQWLYVGNFENFNYSYSEDKQHGAVDFSFEFVASFVYDTAQQGPVERIPSPTPNPNEASSTAGRVDPRSAIDPLLAPLVTQSLPLGLGGSPSTAILNDAIDPFRTPRDLFQGSEIAPGVRVPFGSTVAFPGGNSGGFQGGGNL